MGDNASLDDFLGDESSEQSEGADAAESVDDELTDATEQAADEPAETEADTGAEMAADEPETGDDIDPKTAADVEPAATTYAWDGAGSACAACDETVERRWQQEGDLVCVECKDWERA